MNGFEHSVALKDEAATAALGARIAGALRKGDAVLLSGPLGAGKTVLARAILRARGESGHVPSPTFTLVQGYETKGLTITHFDLYRIEDESELGELGLEEALETGAAIVEWPERAPGRMPENALKIDLRIAGAQAREARISGDARWAGILGGS